MPTKPGEVTVVVRNGTPFTGMLIKEDEKNITLKMSNAEMTWNKAGIKQVLRYKGTPESPSGGKAIIDWKLWKSPAPK